MKPYIFVIISLFAQFAIAENDSWVPSFITGAFQDELEKAPSYRAHYRSNAYIDLKFEEGQAYITLTFLKLDELDHVTIDGLKFSKIRPIEDGFRVGYELKENRVYFDQPLAGIGGGSMGKVDENFYSVAIRRSSNLNEAVDAVSDYLGLETIENSLKDFVFYRLTDQKDGEWFSWEPSGQAELALASCKENNWKDVHRLPAIYKRPDRVWWVPWTTEKLITRYTTPERLAKLEVATEYRMQVSENEYLLAYFTMGVLRYTCETPLSQSYKTFLIGKGFEEVDWATYQRKFEKERINAALKRLADEKVSVEENDVQK